MIGIVNTFHFLCHLHFLSLCFRRYHRKTLNHLGGPSSAALRPKMPNFELRPTILNTFQGKKEFLKLVEIYARESAGGRTDGH